MAEPWHENAWLLALCGNLLVSTVLAGIAWLVHRTARRPALAHLLWVMVLVKLLTPPLARLDVVPAARPPEPVAATSIREAIGTADASALPEAVLPTVPSPDPADLLLVCAVVWLAGSALLLLRSLHTVRRFHRLLDASGTETPPAVQRVADRLATQLGLRRAPRITTTRARVTPFVSWRPGTPIRVVLPHDLVSDCPDTDLRMVLAHELAHVRRRDHLVRWLEWTVGVVFWWNPITWWARRGLRASEELACDALAVACLHTEPRRYAHSLLNVAELLSTPELRAPAMVSAMTSGPTLERRLLNLVNGRTMNTPHWLRASLLGLVALSLPLGFSNAQNFDAVERRLGGAVEAGEITLEQAQIMMDALRRSVGRSGRRDALTSEDATSQRRPDSRADTPTKQQLIDSARRIEQARRAGEISPEEAQAKWDALRSRISGAADESSEHQRALDRATRSTPVMIRADRWTEWTRFTPESQEGEPDATSDAEPAAPGPSTTDRRDPPSDLHLRKIYLDSLAKDLKASIEAGEITHEQAQKKLKEARRKLMGTDGSDSGEARSPQPDRWELTQDVNLRVVPTLESHDGTDTGTEVKLDFRIEPAGAHDAEATKTEPKKSDPQSATTGRAR